MQQVSGSDFNMNVVTRTPVRVSTRHMRGHICTHASLLSSMRPCVIPVNLQRQFMFRGRRSVTFTATSSVHLHDASQVASDVSALVIISK